MFRRTKYLTLILVTLLVTSTLSSAVPAVAAIDTQLDYVNIGDVTSETEHDLLGWSDPWVKPGWGGNYGGGSTDGSLRLLMGPGDGCSGHEDAYFTMDSNGQYARKIVLHHLDGSQPDSFALYILEGTTETLIGEYTGQCGSEYWVTTEYIFSPRIGEITFKLVATAPILSWCPGWGQVGFSWAELQGNQPPDIGSITASLGTPVEVGQSVTFSADFTDPDDTTGHIATWDWGDGNTDSGTVTEPNGSDGSVEDNHSYTEAGVYTITLTVNDSYGGSDSAEYHYAVVYDTTDGFVTGGGWIDSPAGAYASDDTLTGKATFGFVSKYKRGQSYPSGSTEFQFRAGDLNFHSTNYEWLVIANHKAMFRGTGTINGEGSYNFMLSAIDAKLTPSTEDIDLFRIRIWGDSGLVYDNQVNETNDYADPTTEIRGGSIVIHAK